jgi:hypothetical protein
MKRRRYIKTLLFAFLLAIGSAATGPAMSDPILMSAEEQGRRPILDQYNIDVLSSFLNGGSENYEWQQGITASVTGQLTHIALFVGIDESVGDPAPTQLSVTPGAPWQSSVPAWTITTVLRRSGWHTFNLTNVKIFVAVGDQYAIGIHGQSAHNFNPGFGFSRGYEAGEQYLGGDLFMNGSTAGSESNDLLFRTYVKPERIGDE